MPDFCMRRPCPECPWRRDVEPGKFSPQRFRDLAHTAMEGGLRPLFACHMTQENRERACAGFLLVTGWDSNAVRYANIQGRYDPASVSADGPLYATYREMAEANGVDPADPALDGLPEDRDR
jgi:hypothetical protein